jgi:anti-sigma factor RsiW
MSIFTNDGHISRDALTLQILDDLPALWIIPVEQHLSSCCRCQVDRMEISELIADLRRLAKRPPPRDRRAAMTN